MATKKDQTMEMQKQEAVPTEDQERTRSRRCFVPKADIYETDQEIVVLADIPGANEKTVEITLEKSVLTINAFIDPVRANGFELAYAEYEEGDYQRSFHLSNEINQDKIEATVSEGVLRLRLPKSQGAATRKIAVKTV
jgi:HSP20 family molecular chaperone IbpA